MHYFLVKMYNFIKKYNTSHLKVEIVSHKIKRFWNCVIMLDLNRLMNTLNQTLASLGVDMLQANVSVQLDIGKHTDTSTGADLTRLSSRTTWDQPHKKLRKEQS